MISAHSNSVAIIKLKVYKFNWKLNQKSSKKKIPIKNQLMINVFKYS